MLNAPGDFSPRAYFYAISSIMYAWQGDGMAGVLGKGAADDLISSAARKAFQNNKVAQGAFIYFANSLGEGFEEFATEYANALANRLTVKTDQRSFGEVTTDALYSAALGAIISDVIQGGQIAATGRLPSAEELADSAVAQMEQEEDWTEENAAPVQGDVESVVQSEPFRVGRATTIYNPYNGGSIPFQTETSGATVTLSNESLAAAERTIAQARVDAERNGISFKSALGNLYANFKGAQGVPVDNLTYVGEQYTVDVPSGLPKKLASQGSVSESYAILDILPDIIKNGVYVGSGTAITKDGLPKKRIVRYDYFETAVQTDEGDYIVKWDVEVYPNVNNYKTHRLKNIKIAPAEAVPLLGPLPQGGGNCRGYFWE